MEIPLSRGLVAQIDDEDWPLASAYTWCALRSKKKFYAVTTVKRADGTRERVFLHKMLLGLGKGEKGDHKNGDSLDNRRGNLRPATDAQDVWNRRAPQAANKTSAYKGVFFDKAHGRFRASIVHNGERRYLGYFATEQEAAAAYDAECERLRGEWAVLNLAG